MPGLRPAPRRQLRFSLPAVAHGERSSAIGVIHVRKHWRIAMNLRLGLRLCALLASTLFVFFMATSSPAIAAGGVGAKCGGFAGLPAPMASGARCAPAPAASPTLLAIARSGPPSVAAISGRFADATAAPTRTTARAAPLASAKTTMAAAGATTDRALKHI